MGCLISRQTPNESKAMSEGSTDQKRPIDLPDNPLSRFGKTLGRSVLRRCPYCGGPGVFRNWFTLHERCPSCDVLFAPEDGYFLGSYVINIGITAIISLLAVFWMIFGTDLTVIQMQGIAVVLAVALPLFFYPFSLSSWMVLDLLLNPPGDFSRRHRI